MGNTSNKIYVLARLDDAGVRRILTACTDKQEAEKALDAYTAFYRKNEFKSSGYYTEHNEIPNIIAIVRLVPLQAEERTAQGKDYATYVLELYEIDPDKPGDALHDLHSAKIWDFSTLER